MVQIFKDDKPEINDIVLAKITAINELNVVANLIDYNDLNGYISYSELSKKRRFNVGKIVNVGKEVVVQVTGFNNEKNYAELSIRALVDSEIEEFTKYRKKYFQLYNLWRYVFMKLNPDVEMNIDNINSEEINNFMKKSLWFLQNTYEETNGDTFNSEKLYKDLIDSKLNHEIIKNIIDYDIDNIKNILDNYAQIKIIPVKQTKNQEFTTYSYELDGLANIKYSLDYKSFDKYADFADNYDINILYLSSNKYSLNIKQKLPIPEDINIIYDYIVEEIKKRCNTNNTFFSV